MRNRIKSLPVVGPLARRLKRTAGRLPGLREILRLEPSSFRSSSAYWQDRYSTGGTSGAGSYGRLARFKADVLNAFVEEQGIDTVLELGCGDGNQLSLAAYPQYLGVDVSPTAISLSRQRCGDDDTKRFCLLPELEDARADLTLSLDVIYHLVEDNVFEAHMQLLFSAARRFVIIYSSDADVPVSAEAPHVRHRCFSTWVAINAPAWRLRERIENRFPFDGDGERSSRADFYVYERRSDGARPT